MKIGAHESTSGGMHKAIERAIDDGCESLQVFVKNQKRWTQRSWTDKEAETFRTTYEESGLDGLMAHASYLINLCTNKAESLRKSKLALVDELNRCAQLGVPYLVMHPGSHVGQGEDVGLEQIAKNLEEVYANEVDDAWADVTLLFENTAGQGTNLGYKLEHIADLFDKAHDPTRFGVCFDTCHAHAAGYDLTTEDAYEAFWGDFDAIVGLDRLKAFHLNDSKFGLGSRKDRHEQIGDGEVGVETFRLLMNDERFADHPGSLETPSLEDGSTSYKLNLEVLRGLRA